MPCAVDRLSCPDHEVVPTEGDVVPVSREVALANGDTATVTCTRTLGGEVGEGLFFRYRDMEGRPSTCEQDGDTSAWSERAR